jgi:hypothetical protein
MFLSTISTMLIRTKSDYLDNNILIVNHNEFIIDQQQLLHDDEVRIHSGLWVAQSFKPSMTPLAKIQIKIKKFVIIDDPLEISIRKNLSGNELSFTRIPSNQIPYHTFWIEIDIPDIEVNIGDTYYIVVRTNSPAGKSYCWLDKHDDNDDPYNNGKQWISYNNGFDWESAEDEDNFIDSTFITYSYIYKTDLYCTGFLNWTNITPAATINGFFTVENQGSPLSYLNWKITNWPSWGIWSFNPSEGFNLRPEDGIINVQITVRAPNITNNRYNGKITIENLDNPDDYCVVDAFLATPVNRDSIELIIYRDITYLKNIFKYFRTINLFFYN